MPSAGPADLFADLVAALGGIGVGASLDVARIRTTLKLLEDALVQSDLTPMLERELARWRRSG